MPLKGCVQVKRKLMLITLLSVVVILAAAAGIIFYFFRESPKPDEALRQYMEYVRSGQYEAMYAMLDEQSKVNISEEKFIERNKNIYEGIQASDIQVDVREVKDKSAPVHYTTAMTTIAGRLTFENEAVLHKEDGQWKLKWRDGLILPDLTSTDKVSVTTQQAERGNIYDRNKNMLAGKGTIASVGLVPGKMSGNSEDVEMLAQILGITADVIENKLFASWVQADTFVPVKSLKLAAMTDELQAALLAVPGVMINEAQSRVYPYGGATAHLLGYVQGISAEELEELSGKGYTAQSVIGKSGLEKLYEDRLHGTDGCKISIIDSEGSSKAVVAMQTAQNGEDIYTTIDIGVQSKLYEQFKEDRSCSVAMNPKTGEVLALVSTPAYDSNDFVLGMSQEQWDSLNNDEQMPLYNRFRAALCPGSAFKPVIAGIGLSAGLLDPNENFGYTGLSWQKDAGWGSYKITTLHEYGNEVILKNALIYSDNIYFAKVALKIGADTLAERLTALGFNESVPFEIGMSPSQYANEGTIDGEIQLADTGYGQGQVLVNPLHMACMYSAFVNDGNMIQPYLEYDAQRQPNYWISQAFTPEAAKEVLSDLIQVVENPNGTGHGAYMEGRALAGKTGTGEIKASQEDTSGTELGWFNVMTADTDTADALFMLTMVEDVHDRGGSSYVVNQYRPVLEALLK